MNNADKIVEYDFLLQSLSRAYKSLNIENLNELIEHIRSEGILYQDYPIENCKLLEALLRIALDLIKKKRHYTLDNSWWFIMELYDIVFHQVQMKEYPSICAHLYFELSKDILDTEFHHFYKMQGDYSMCIYFVLMAYNWFSYRKEEFLVLYKKLNPLINEEPDHLEAPWINKYKEELTK